MPKDNLLCYSEREPFQCYDMAFTAMFLVVKNVNCMLNLLVEIKIYIGYFVLGCNPAVPPVTYRRLEEAST